ncbi:hypothetical protein VTK56DRAFT_5976 [Thermocarpiscus australiensis]
MKAALIAPLFASTALSSPVQAAAAADPTSTPSPTTLEPVAYWIRAVVPPNYHKSTFVDGQLVNKLSSPPLYLWVEEPADNANPQRTLAAWFNTTQNPFGTFAWQGDALTWSVPSINGQNVAAWLVCEKQALFVNAGAYAYQTPAGCADQTMSAAAFLDLWRSSAVLHDMRNFMSKSVSSILTRIAVRYTITTTRPQTAEIAWFRIVTIDTMTRISGFLSISFHSGCPSTFCLLSRVT